MRDRSAGLSVENVRVTLTITLEIVAVIAGGREPHSGDAHDLLDAGEGGRRFDTDLPGVAVRVGTCCQKVAADFYHEIRHSQRRDGLTHNVDAVTFADGGQVNLSSWLRLLKRVRGDENVAHFALGEGDFCLARNRLNVCCSAEAPCVDERPGGHVEVTVGEIFDLVGGGHNGGKRRRNGERLGACRIKARHFGGRIPVRHLGVYVCQDRINGPLQLRTAQRAVAIDGHDRIGRAHRHAGDF